jgi:hypothetical protein
MGPEVHLVKGSRLTIASGALTHFQVASEAHMAKPKRQPAAIRIEAVVSALKKMLVSRSGLDWRVTRSPHSAAMVPWILVTSPLKRMQGGGEMPIEDRVALSKILGLRIPAAGIKFVARQAVLAGLLKMCEEPGEGEQAG